MVAPVVTPERRKFRNKVKNAEIPSFVKYCLSITDKINVIDSIIVTDRTITDTNVMG